MNTIPHKYHQIEYDPTQIIYQELLTKFWEIHDPTSLNRQGADRGEQYRSVIFYHTPQQKIIAFNSKKSLQLSDRYEKDIVTEIKPNSDYYLATEDHQQYLEKKRQNS
nr:peptide-methionine (S)-S-oxide reductase MsrA [Hyella patelloides]